MTTQKTRRPISNRFAWTMAAALLIAAPGHAAGTADGHQDGAPLADERASYSFLRTIEGDATVAGNGEGVGTALEINQPLLTGDLVRVGPGSRLELALSDRNRLYLDAETGVSLERIAFSGDRDERVTVLRLEGGELVLLVPDEALGDELPSVITANATVYIQQPGEYRVEAGIENNGESWTRVVTRRGYAEIVTDRGSSVVREGESMLAQGDRQVRLALASADDPDALEAWTAELTGRAVATSRSAQYVEPQLAYDAAPLDDAGNWVDVQGVRYWRPYVSSGWRPYSQGRWSWTPSGYTWISYEPWGWVPYHYGRWCSLPGYGWAWRPGAVYSPAWVYWNWTSGYAAWIPMGYYSHYYDPWYGGGFRYGVYGWAGGGWGIYSDWNFAPVHCFRDRNFRGHIRSGRDFQRESGLREPPRGLLTTDTRDFRPDRIDRTEDLMHQIGRRGRANVNQELPDVTDFVGRRGRLPNDLAREIVKGDRTDRGVIQDIAKPPRVAESPGWRAQDTTRSDGSKDRSGIAKPPVVVIGKGDSNVRDRSTGTEPSKPGATVPRDGRPAEVPALGSKPSTPQANVPVAGSKPSIPRADGRVQDSKPGGQSTRNPIDRSKPPVPQSSLPGEDSKPSKPQTRVPVQDSKPAKPQTNAPVNESKDPLLSARPRDIGKQNAVHPDLPGAVDNRQGWKDKTGENAPVQRVVGSVRRPSPDYGSPTTPSGGSKSGGPTQSSAGPGKGSGDSQAYRPSSGYGKGGGVGSQGSQSGSSHDRNPASTNRRVPVESPADPGHGKGSSAGSQGAQGGPAYGRTPSSSSRNPQGSQGTSNYGKGSSGSQSTQGNPAHGRSPSAPQSSPGYGKGSSSGSAGSRGSTGSQGHQGSPGYGRGTASTPPSSQGSSYGRGSSGPKASGGGSSSPKGSQGSGKGSAGSDARGSGKGGSSSKGSSSAPPPDTKSDDGGH
jgi:hypothetical protein